ncbi:MAG: hypothetical protein GWO44_17305, partial [Thermoplasmata archaeon]|nr:hypothetical protein [Thermoplasmata archaeon]NIY04959.1 hypothetical protein [Thermoplasmata archaeon]
HFRIANFVSDDATAGAVFEFRRVSGDDYNPKIWANDDYIGIFSRWADSTAADTYQSAVIVGGNPGVGQSRV